MVLTGFTIGQMRSTAIFKINTPTTNATAEREAIEVKGLNDSYSTLLITRCRLRKQRGQRNLVTGEITNSQSFEMICRVQSGIDNNLRTDTKIDIGNFRYTIDTWEKVDEIDHWYKFILNVEKQFSVNSIPISDGTYSPSPYGVFKLPKTLLSGETFITDSDLIPSAGLSITILSVAREGVIYSQTSGTPGDLEYKYTSASGKIEFRDIGNSGGEKIEIVFKNI